jgi:hypothetical protein
MAGERSQASSLITVGCITRETRAKDYRGFAAMQHNLRFRVGEEQLEDRPMAGTAFFTVILAALVAVKGATRIGVDSGRFDDLPRPSQID